MSLYKIRRRKNLTPVTVLFEVEAPLVARKAQPGQFVIVRTGARGERIPLTIADYDRQKGTVTIVFQEVGKSTKDLGRLREGDAIDDFVGPLGLPAELPEKGSVLCVGGGFGVAPVLPKAKAMHEKGVKVTSIIGARTNDLIILVDEMRAVSDEVFICTDDGSCGEKGLVTDLIAKLLNEGRHFDEVVAIGPLVMMKAVSELTRSYGLKTVVSMNPIMVDGTGMCGACRVTVGGETKFACVDGPLFDGHLVDFDEAMRRNRMYIEEEKLALERCQCGGDGCCR